MLRTYRINFKRNWSVSPTKWNRFWSNLELDMLELKNEMDSESISFSDLFDHVEDILETGNKTKVDKII